MRKKKKGASKGRKKTKKPKKPAKLVRLDNNHVKIIPKELDHEKPKTNAKKAAKKPSKGKKTKKRPKKPIKCAKKDFECLARKHPQICQIGKPCPKKYIGTKKHCDYWTVGVIMNRHYKNS
jgi:hypothetical protein